MPSIFISYSRRREAVVQTLIGDLEDLGHAVWYDKELTGGKPWWDGILAQIRSCEVFVLAVSPETLESKACKREWRYAADLGKIILPVLITEEVTPDALPARLQTIQSVDYRKLDRAAGLGLARAFNTLPASPPLPDPLPSPPEVPISDLATLRDLVESETSLTQQQQAEIVTKLRRLSREAATRPDAFNLLHALERRSDLFADIDDDIEELLKVESWITTQGKHIPPDLVEAERQSMKAVSQPIVAAPLTVTGVPLSRRINYGILFGFLGAIGGAACMASLVDPSFGNDVYAWVLLTGGGAWFLGFATVGRISALIWPITLGLVAAVGFAFASDLSLQRALAPGLVVFQPVGWVVAIVLRAIARKFRPLAPAIPS